MKYVFKKKFVFHNTALFLWYNTLWFWLIYLTNNYYSSFLKDSTKEILIFFYIAYLIITPFMFFFQFKKES